MGIEGGEKSEKQATEMIKDLAKFLWFASSSSIDIDQVIDRAKVLGFIEKLRQAGIGSSGQVNKLNVIIVAISWLISLIPDSERTEAHSQKLHKAMLCKEKLKAMKKTVAKEKVCNGINGLLFISDCY